MLATKDLQSEFFNVGHETINVYVHYFKGIYDLRCGISISISTCRQTTREGERFYGPQLLLLVSGGGREHAVCV